MSKNARQLAFEILLKIEKDKAYSNLTVDSVLSSSTLDTRDKAFVSNLVYGVTERRITLDYQLSQYLTQPLKKLKLQVLIILRMGVYQIFYMDKVPDSAAVNESVKLSKENKLSFASSLINAVLRKCSDNGLVFPKEEDKEYISVLYSCPLWLCEKLIREYGREDAEKFLASCDGSADTVIRVNTLKTDATSLIEKLEGEGVKAEKGYVENSLIIDLEGKEITKLSAYKNGLFHVQDTASQLCARALCAKRGDTVFDLCAAPGGKSFTVSQYMENEGRLYSFDLYEHRAGLIRDGAERLGISVLTAETGDASVFNEKLGMADKVLCDVPCSGLGIIRRKPEIKYKDRESLDGLFEIQYSILENGARYVKEGGRLIYSTCTLNKDENENVCRKFIKLHKNFRQVAPLPEISDEVMLTLMPHKNNSDGFFIAAFVKE